jgi:NTE family protein
VIGSNVTGNAPPPSDDNVVSQIRSMMTGMSNYNILTNSGILIEPKTNIGLFDFDDPQKLIDSGYVSTIRVIKKIKEAIGQRPEKQSFEKKRAAFLKNQHDLIFDKITVTGLNDNQSQYIQRSVRTNDQPLSLEKLKIQYFKLAADEQVKDVFPKAIYNPNTGMYDLYLKMKRQKELIAFLGGDLSTRPISEGFVGLKYNYLGKTAVSIDANTYFALTYRRKFHFI